MKRRLISVLLATTLVFSITGCGNSNHGKSSTSDGIKDTVISKEDVVRSETSSLLASIASFKSAEVNEEYSSPMYNLPSNYVFEFDANEKAGNVAYKAFSVYDNADFENRFSASYCKCTYENGKIKVAPNDVLVLNESSSINVNNGTWGSLNKMYLVQNIDLQTGEDLSKPIVTPFSVQHDLDAPTVTQGVNESNLYTLSWSPVKGATKYRVYEHFGNTAYQLECTTTNTSVTVEEFKTQKKSENYDDLVKQDLQNMGYEVDDGYTFMNSGARYNDDFDGYFTVVAVDASGKQSGISNIVDVRDIANKLPLTVKDNIDITVQSVLDAPTYVDVEMVDGSTAQMLIDYHGAQTYKFEGEDKVVIMAHVCNTLFDNFVITLRGISYDDFMKDVNLITERQDSLNKTGGSSEPVINIPSTPSNDSTPDDEIAKEEVQDIMTVPAPSPEVSEKESEISTEESSVSESSSVQETTEIHESSPDNLIPEPQQGGTDVTPEGYSTYDLYLSAVQEVEGRLAQIGDVDNIIYASDKLGAWLAYGMMAQMNIIPIPTSVFPEVANEDYLGRICSEAYRQNPTSGVMTNIGYSYEYESLVIEYAEDANMRLNKSVKEINKAKELADSIVQSGMSDTEKIIAINNYICGSASYDTNSCATDVDMNNLSESFIDAHTPYGILLNNYGVCESYSEAFALIGRFAGLDVVMETGMLQGGAHEWNRVNADGSWCIVDVTNNDMDLGSNALLNVTESQVNGILIPDYVSYTVSLPATDNTKEYYYVSNKCANSASEAESILAEQIRLGDIAQVRLPLGTSEDEAANIARNMMQNTGVQLSNAIYFANVLAVTK